MSTSFLASVLEYYQEVSQKALERWNVAQSKIEKGEYGPDEITADALALWLHSVDTWWSSALRPVTSALPVAFFSLQVGEAGNSTTVPVRFTKDGDVAATDLVGPADSISAAKHVGRRFVENNGVKDRTQLVVELRNLTNHNGSGNPTPAGLYHGVAFVGQIALAHIVVFIRTP